MVEKTLYQYVHALDAADLREAHQKREYNNKITQSTSEVFFQIVRHREITQGWESSEFSLERLSKFSVSTVYIVTRAGFLANTTS